MAQIYGFVPSADRPAGKKQVEWYPLKCTVDSSGLYSTLKVDTELSIDALTLNIDNLFVASNDGAASGARHIKVKADGTVYIEGSVTVTGDVEVVQDTYADLKNQGKLVNVAETIINPATEDKQDDIVTELQDVESDVEACKGVLDDIKTNTDKIPASPATEGKQDDVISKLEDIEDEVEDHESYKCIRVTIGDGDDVTIDVVAILGKAGRFIRLESNQDIRLQINGGDIIHISDSPWTWDTFKFTSIYIENPSGYGAGHAEIQLIITG